MTPTVPLTSALGPLAQSTFRVLCLTHIISLPLHSSRTMSFDVILLNVLS